MTSKVVAKQLAMKLKLENKLKPKLRKFFRQVGHQELVINGPQVQGEINPAGEQDLYTLNVTTAGTYTIDTSGTTDTFLSLFGPDSDTTLVAADDDSGPGLLSLLVEHLEVGRYLVQVRHFSPFGSGPYGITLSSNDGQ